MLPDFPPTFWSNETSGACKPEVFSVFIIKRCLFFPCIADKNFGAVNVDHTIYLYLIRQCCDVGSVHSAKFLRRPSHTLCRRHSHGHWRHMVFGWSFHVGFLNIVENSPFYQLFCITGIK